MLAVNAVANEAKHALSLWRKRLSFSRSLLWFIAVFVGCGLTLSLASQVLGPTNVQRLSASPRIEKGVALLTNSLSAPVIALAAPSWLAATMFATE